MSEDDLRVWARHPNFEKIELSMDNLVQFECALGHTFGRVFSQAELMQ